MGLFKKKTKGQPQPAQQQEAIYIHDAKVTQVHRINCPNCGGSVKIDGEQKLCICQNCGSQLEVGRESPDFAIDRNVLTKYSGQDDVVQIPDGIKTIGTIAFAQSPVKKVILPGSVKEINNSAFWNCKKLETVIMPDSLESIGHCAFSGCVSLKSIILPNNLLFLDQMAFHECRKLESIVIPPQVESFEISAFLNCERLQTISYYQNTRFASDYLSGCTSMISMKILDIETGKIISEKKANHYGADYRLCKFE